MNHCFVESIARNRTVKLVGCSLLNLNYFLVLVFAVLVVPNSSQAFRKGDAVAAQNRGPGGYVIVREEAHISDPWDENLEAQIPNGTRGTVLSGPKSSDQYLWYEVRWEELPAEKNLGFPRDGNLPIEGWSAVTVNGCDVIGTAQKADHRDAIVEALFRGLPHETDHLHEATNHDYNGHGCFPSGADGYEGGHSGWDVQTHSVAGLASTDEPFYSLTPGIVIIANEGTLNRTSVIAIYNAACDKTTLYLHAREVDNAIRRLVGEYIGDNIYLGIQGNTGLWPLATAAEREKYKNNPDGGAESFREHVHIEVIEGDLRENTEIKLRPARGAIDSIDPIPYLYRWVNGDLRAGFLPSDINHDGDVDFFDLIGVIMSLLGKFLHGYDSRSDVNSDGVVDRKDIDEVKEHYGKLPPRSPEISMRNPIDGITKRAGQFFIGGTAVSPEIVQQLLEIVREEDGGSMIFKHGIVMLENLLAAMTSEVIIPDKTGLFANYPNPFNPETWMPYHLARDTEVTIKIYDTTGALVHLLDMGYQKAGDYTSPRRAAYWDGRTEFGERVASGIYFYTFTAGDYTATRKMVVLK